jgi:hypothetical protein
MPDVVPEGFEDISPPSVSPQQAAAGMGQVPMGAAQPLRRGRPAAVPQQAMAAPVGQEPTSGGSVLAAFLGGLLVAGIGIGAYHAYKGRGG